MGTVAECKSIDAGSVPAKSLAGPRVRPLLLLLASAAVLRAVYHLIFWPWWSGDTISYLDAGYLLSHGYFTDGARTPVYPLFLALARWVSRAPTSYFDPASAVTATGLQSLLGVIAVGLVYDTLRKLRVRARLAVAGGLFFALLNGVCEFEMVVLAQSLSLFALVLGSWLYVTTVSRVERGEPFLRLATLTGISFGLAILVRPENAAVFAVLVAAAAWLWFRTRRDQSSPHRFFGALTVTLPLAAAPLLLGWMTWNYVGIGRFQLTTLTSWNMNSSVYNLFDRVDSEDQVLGELLAKANLIRNHPEKAAGERFWLPAQPGQVVQDTYWATLGEIIRRRKEMPLPPPAETSSRFGKWVRSFGTDDARRYTHTLAAAVRIGETIDRDPNDIGDYMDHVAWKLVRRYPGAWLRNAAANFFREAFRFRFSPPGVSQTLDPHAFEGGTVVRNPSLRNVALWLDRIEAPLMTGLFALTLGLFLLAPWTLVRSPNDNTVFDTIAAALATGVVATFAACCLFACYMPHYGIPYWGTIVICGVYAIDRLGRLPIWR
jgi:hypothetical protein